ncbi:hypothetical protein BJ875DRAFT_497863 [Amylocarpus encephaloides]|uniref:DUF6594 domain-containing protein n=1 Tax=Amylocarpus encephaloides TaxID=45428 RepID=A0A9P7YEQ7_9HELO|nr:hypothetical protein BJ875DRAFT_497863 [Amylocarpus encephaloides]
MNRKAPGGHNLSNLETRTREEHTGSPPTAADARSDDVARMLRLLQDDTMSIFQRVKDKRNSGEYHFDRYETMQLLNLCFYQVEIRPLESGIFELLESKDKDEDTLLDLANKISLLRQLLKEYNAALLSFHQLMSFKVAEEITKEYDQTIHGGPWVMIDVAHRASQDYLRDFLGWLLGANPKKGPFPQQSESLPTIERTNAHATLEEIRVHQIVVRKRREIADFLARIFISFIGGALLLVPMTIMALKNDLEVSIGVTWAFVMLFVILVSFMSKATNPEALAATAAFTAVLVVFTGSQTNQ